MRRKTACILAALALCMLLATAHAEPSWPHWRGPSADGIAAGNPPSTWSETENIVWKVAVPGEGHATPIVWGDRIFVSTAIATAAEAARESSAAERPQGPPREGGFGQGGPGAPGGPGGPGAARGGGRPGGFREGAPGPPGGRGGFGGGRTPTVPYKFAVVCLDRATGKTLWETTLAETIPHEAHHGTGSFAPYSPVTDGTHLYVSFGSRGLYCMDFDGKVVWSQDLMDMRTRNSFGEGSSPALAGDSVVVLLDHEGDSKIAAYDKKSGALLWERPRDEKSSWSTPFAVTVKDRTEVIVNATNRIRSYDAKTGDLIWECGGQTENVIPTPVAGFDMVYCTSGYRGNALQAIKLGRSGDLTGTDAIAWEVSSGTPYVPSPLLIDEKLYVLSHNRGVLSSYEAKSGKPVFVEKAIEGLRTVYASPVAAGGKIYIADREGSVAVLDLEGSVIATNQLDEGCNASPVVVGDVLYLRGDKHLYCIAKK